MMAKITTWLSLYKVLHELPLYSILALNFTINPPGPCSFNILLLAKKHFPEF
jgi:hypothetical protein